MILRRNWGTDTIYQSEDGLINKEDYSSDFYPSYVFHIYLGEKKSAWHVVAAESPADSIAFKARIRNQGQLY